MMHSEEHDLYPCPLRDAYEKISYEITKNGEDSIHNVVKINGAGEDQQMEKEGH